MRKQTKHEDYLLGLNLSFESLPSKPNDSSRPYGRSWEAQCALHFREYDCATLVPVLYVCVHTYTHAYIQLNFSEREKCMGSAERHIWQDNRLVFPWTSYF